VLRVYDNEPPATPLVRRFQHGRIVHGLQFLDPARRMEPNAYYTARTGIALALQRHPKREAGSPLRIGVLGLGVGTIAAWGQPDDVIRFYEINPQVIEIARNYFTFLDESPATTEIVTGDGRLELEREVSAGTAERFDVLAIDAFSGDAVPVHLLTREGVALYWRALEADGILAFNITNRYLDLAPVVRGVAREFDKQVVQVISAGTGEGALQSDWMLLTSNQEFLTTLRGPQQAEARQAPNPRTLLWTDSFSNLFEVLR
jgi:spermidine synthase